jgi:hypothetical protein
VIVTSSLVSEPSACLSFGLSADANVVLLAPAKVVYEEWHSQQILKNEECVNYNLFELVGPFGKTPEQWLFMVARASTARRLPAEHVACFATVPISYNTQPGQCIN